MLKEIEGFTATGHDRWPYSTREEALKVAAIDGLNQLSAYQKTTSCGSGDAKLVHVAALAV